MLRKPFIIMAVVAGALAGCAEQQGYGYGGGYGAPSGNYQESAAVRTLGGAVAGAVIADATGGSKTKGALIGAVAGGVSCGIQGLPPCR